jgi:hypothetical protein
MSASVSTAELLAILEEAQVAACVLAAENPTWFNLWLRIDVALTALRAPSPASAPAETPE